MIFFNLLLDLFNFDSCKYFIIGGLFLGVEVEKFV